MHRQVKRILNFHCIYKTMQIAIFEARTEKRYIFYYLIEAKNWPRPNGITEKIISDINFLSKTAGLKKLIICWHSLIACCLNFLYDYVGRKFMPWVVSGLHAGYPL